MEPSGGERSGGMNMEILQFRGVCVFWRSCSRTQMNSTRAKRSRVIRKHLCRRDTPENCQEADLADEGGEGQVAQAIPHLLSMNM